MNETPETDDGSTRWQYARGDRSKRNGPLRRAFRVVRRRVVTPAVPVLAPLALRSLAATWRMRITRPELRREALESPDGCIAVLWHGRMAAAAPIFSGVDATILVSASGDGDLAELLLSRLGYHTLRGSTGKMGADALRVLRERLDRGGTIALTPDGPRGPRHRVNRGAAFLARATGRPILPIGFGVDRARRLSSWDRFTIPSPFARVHVVFGEPIRLGSAESGGESSLAATSARIGDALMDAERQAFAALGTEVDW